MEDKEEALPDILIAYEFDKSSWAINHTDSGSIDDFYQYSLIDEFLYKKVFNNWESILGFGKYEGRTIRYVYEAESSYLEFCIRELNFFYLTSDIVKSLLSDGYQFSNETVLRYKQKLCDYRAGVWLSNKRDDEADEDYNSGYYSSGDNEDDWGGNIDSNPYYNDDLDMDQQSQEFWDNL